MAKKSNTTAAANVLARLSALESHVKSLEQSLAAPKAAHKSQSPNKSPRASKHQRHWAIEELQGIYPESGGVTFAGYVTLPLGATYAWQIDSTTDALLEADWSIAQAPLTALAHPVRLSILKAILYGKQDTQSLQMLPEMGTTGQLYHHLKELESAGWIRQPRRGEYNLLAERIVPLLAILAACEVTYRSIKR